MPRNAYRVGELYAPGRTNWPEGAEYNYRASAHELRLFYANISDAETKAITRRPAEFGAVAVGSVLFFLYMFQSDDAWSDCPYNWHLVQTQRPDEATEPPPLEEQERAVLTVVLIESTTGIIAGIRLVTLSINLSRALHQQIAAQIAMPFDARAYDEEIATIYRSTPVAQLARQAERMRVQ